MALNIVDLDFEPRVPMKCKRCGKIKENHLANTLHCPIGARHSVLGYTQYSAKTVFALKDSAKKQVSFRAVGLGYEFTYEGDTFRRLTMQLCACGDFGCAWEIRDGRCYKEWSFENTDIVTISEYKGLYFPNSK